MKKFLAIGLAALFLFGFVVEWRAFHPRAVPAAAYSSQIYIHGTPVCVFRNGESIVARVGECGSEAGQPEETPGAPVPDDEAPGLSLPPGHPPVGPGMSPDGGGRRVLI